MHLAQQLGVIPEKIIPYDWEGRTIKAHRAAIRTFLDVHEATLADEEAVVEWLCQQVLTEQRQEEALIASVYTHCKDGRIEPPTPDRVRRLVHTVLHRFDERLCTWGSRSKWTGINVKGIKWLMKRIKVAGINTYAPVDKTAYPHLFRTSTADNPLFHH